MPRSDEDEARLASLRDKLLAVRGKRVRPGLDDKVLADWNGLMIAALANAGVMLGEPAWIDMARPRLRLHCAQHDQRRPARPFLARGPAAVSRPRLRLRRHDPGGAGAVRGDRRGRYLDAGAGLAAGARRAITPIRSNGGYFLTADDAEGLVVRPASTSDDATPNPNAIAAQNLVRLAVLTGDTPMARAGRPAVRRRAAGRRRQPVRACRAAQRARSAPARRRDRGRPGRSAPASPRRR